MNPTPVRPIKTLSKPARYEGVEFAIPPDTVIAVDPAAPGSDYTVFLVLTHTRLEARLCRPAAFGGHPPWPRNLRKSQKATRRRQRFEMNKALRHLEAQRRRAFKVGERERKRARRRVRAKLAGWLADTLMGAQQ